MSSDDRDVLEPELEQRLRRGLAALAEEAPAEGRAFRRHLPAAVAAAAVVIAVGAFLAGNVGGSDDSDRVADPQPSVSSGTVPPIGHGIQYDLADLVRTSDRVVVGTIGDVEHHAPSDATGGLAYVIATVDVDETVKGPEETQLVAFDYDYEFGDAVTTTPGMGARFVRGERVLLFLSSSAGTVHAQLDPPHWQVTGGAQGEYAMDGDEPVAPFSMADVRDLARS